MLVYTASLVLALFHVDEGIAAVEHIGREAGGYLLTREDRAITIRVPREHFANALAQVEKLGDVVHRQVSAEDVTDEYVDVQIRLQNARALRDRLEHLLQNATVTEAVNIEKQLAAATEDIERMEGRLKLLRERVAFSTIAVAFQPESARPVRGTALLPFPWMKDLGLAKLLDVGDGQ
jgi:hypothetical protein